MTNSRKARIRRQRQRRALLTMALVLVTVFACIGGTIAWLTATSGEVTNTFTVGDINIDLNEHAYVDGKLTENVTKKNSYKAYPGAVLDKDPFVTVEAKSEDCYVFVCVENSIELDNNTIVATMNTDTANWTKVGETGNKVVYMYKAIVEYSESKQDLPAVFSKVTIDSAAVTKENIKQLEGDQIIINAYAHQANETTDVDATTAALAHFSVAAAN